MLFDTHAHYDARRFDSDRHELLGSMQQNGVGRILNAGCDLESSRVAIELAHQYDFLYAAVGSHPGYLPGASQRGKSGSHRRNRPGLLL